MTLAKRVIQSCLVFVNFTSHGSDISTDHVTIVNAGSTGASIGPAQTPLPAVAPMKATNVVDGSMLLAIIDPNSKEDFEKKMLPALQNHLGSCRKCRVENHTPYNESGAFESSALLAKLETLPTKNAVLVLLWNRKFQKEDAALVEKLKALMSGGLVVVATSGRPEGSQATLSLSRTLWGQVPNLIIIGEIEDRERLVNGTFYGPEMLTALRTPVEMLGVDRSAFVFAARLAAQAKTRDAQQWYSHLKERKSKLRRLWPSIEDFF